MPLANTPLGKLTIVATYAFHDEPLLFVCRNASTLYIATLSAEENDTRTWLYVPITLLRFAQLRNGSIDFHDAFTKSETGMVYEFKVDSAGAVDTKFRWASEVTDDELPVPGELAIEVKS